VPWVPLIVKTVATTDDGLAELVEATERHHAYLRESGRLEERRGRELAAEVGSLVRDMAGQAAHAWARTEGTWEETLAQVTARRVDPRTAAHGLITRFLAHLGRD
jgi:LAO/AO transport system kinase